MDKRDLLEKFEKCLKTVGEFDDMASIELTRFDGDWSVTLRVWPKEKDDSATHKTIAACTSVVGELRRDEDLGWFRGKRDGVTVDVVVNKPCKVIGHKIQRRAVTRTIETGDFVDVRVPVTDCDLRKGNVSAGEFEPLEEVTA